MGVLDLGRVDEAIPFLQAALSIRTEIDDLEEQHIDLTHSRLPTAAARREPAAIARFLAGSRDIANGMYRHDRRALDAVLEAVANTDTAQAAGFEAARQLVSHLGDN
jgi:hypothetical protein